MRRNLYTSRPRDSYPARLLRALYSAIIPGVGQLVAGARRRGFVLLVLFIMVALAGAFILTRGIDTVAAWVVQPKILLGLLWVNVVIMLLRMYAVIDAWFTAKVGTLKPVRPSGPGVVATGVGLVLILLLTLTPHAVLGYYTVVSHSLLTTVFAGDDETGSTTTSASSTNSTRTSTSGRTTSSVRGTTSSTLESSTTQTSESTTTTVPLEWGSDGRMTVLLIGTDEGYGRSGARSDSMNVVSIDMKTGKVAMFGLPRNTSDVPLGQKTAKALGTKTYHEMLNALYAHGSKHPEIAPNGNPGAEAVRETASLILGIPIDYYAVVNMLGLVDMVDALGGIDVNVGKPMQITYFPLNPGEPKKTYTFKKGVNHLDGLEALAFARNRSDSDDYVRMGRQRCVLMAMLYQNSVSRLALRFPKIASALEKSVETNIPLKALPELVKLRGKVKTDDMITVGFTPPDWISGYSARNYNVLDFPKVRAAVKTILKNPKAWIDAHPAATGTGGVSDCWTVSE